MRPWGGHENFRVVRYIHANWYGRQATRWKVEETIGQYNDFVGWHVQYELAEFGDEGKATRYCQRITEEKRVSDLERARRAIRTTEEVVWQSGRKR